MNPLDYLPEFLRTPFGAKPPATPTGAITPYYGPGGGAIVPPDGVQRINTNMNVPGGKPRVPGFMRVGGAIQAVTSDDPATQFLGGMTVTNPIMGTTLSVMDQINRGADALFGTGDTLYSGRAPGSGMSSIPKSKDKRVPQEKRGFADLRGSVTPGSMEPAPTNIGEGAAFDAAERYRKGAGYPQGVERPADYPVKAVTRERNDAAPDDSGYEGTNTGFKGFDIPGINANLALTGSGTIMDATRFLSSPLPVTKPGADQQQLANPSQPPEGAPTVSPDGNPYMGPAFGIPQNDAVVEGPSTPNPGKITDTQSADNARSVSVPGENKEGWSMARRRAFLDPNLGSMAAYKAANAAVGAFDQATPYGHQYSIRVGDEMKYVNKDTYRKYTRTGELSPDDFLEGYSSGVKSTLVPVSQPDITNPGATVAPTPAGEFNANNIPPSEELASSFNPSPLTTGHAEQSEVMKRNYFKKK